MIVAYVLMQDACNAEHYYSNGHEIGTKIVLDR